MRSCRLLAKLTTRNLFTQACFPIKSLKNVDHFLTCQLNEDRVSATLLNVNIDDLNLNARIFELGIEPLLELFRRQAQIQLDSINDDCASLGDPLQIILLVETGNLLNFLVELRLQRVMECPRKLTLSFGNPLESIPKQLVPMLVHIGDRTLRGLLLEVGVDVVLFLPASALISTSVVMVPIALVEVATLIVFVRVGGVPTKD